jgi:lipopolysaccharide export LptBFGC system permease protein LptF
MSAGKMIMAGAITGLGLSLLKQVIENTGLVMGFNPILTVLVPLVLILAVAWMMLRRVD